MFEYTYSRFCDSQLFADGKLLPHLQNKSYLWDKAGNLFMVVGVQLHVVSVAGVHLQKRIFSDDIKIIIIYNIYFCNHEAM